MTFNFVIARSSPLQALFVHRREKIWLVLDVNGILVRSTKCDNVNIRKTLESQHSLLITGELAPLFLPYSGLIPRKGLFLFLRFVFFPTSMLSSGHRSLWRIFIQLSDTSSKVVDNQSMCLGKNCVTLWRMREDNIFLVIWTPIQASSWKTWAHFLNEAERIQCRIRSYQLIELHYLLMTPLTNASLTLLGATLTRPHFCQIRAWILCIITCKGCWVLNGMFQILWGATLIHQAKDPSI